MNQKIVLFILIVCTIYTLVNTYVLVRTWQALAINPTLRITVIGAFLFCALCFLVGMVFEQAMPFSLTLVLQNIGYVWMGALLFGFLSCVLVDLVRVANYLIPFFPQQMYLHYAQVKAIFFVGIFAIIFATLLIGNIRFRNPVVVKLNLETKKELNSANPLKILMISDVHMGYVVRNGMVEKYVRQINSLQPDIVFCVGDLTDRELKPVKKQNLLAKLDAIQAPMGFYMVPGNHEYIGDVATVFEYISTNSKIKVLCDSVVNVNDELIIVGRDDRSNPRRKTLANLTDSVRNTNLPLVLLDHQPYHLEESEANKIDLHLSGHTHNGQIWPLNFIVKKVYEVGYGYKKKGDTHIYVSSGLGLWGPPFRIGTQSEMVLITFHKAAN